MGFPSSRDGSRSVRHDRRAIGKPRSFTAEEQRSLDGECVGNWTSGTLIAVDESLCTLTAVLIYGREKHEYRETDMTDMKDRQRAFENKFALDEEQKFKASVRRNKLLGRGAADLLGRDADAYAKEVVETDFQEAGDEDVFRKLRADFDAAGVSISDEDIRQKMFAFLQDAVIEVKQ